MRELSRIFVGLRDIWAKVTVSIGYGGYVNKSQVVAMIYFTRSITVQMRGSRIEGANTAYTLTDVGQTGRMPSGIVALSIGIPKDTHKSNSP